MQKLPVWFVHWLWRHWRHHRISEEMDILRDEDRHRSKQEKDGQYQEKSGDSAKRHMHNSPFIG
jgi:hypothetical protein